jgi:putative ABC transport system substrate-binding protein
VKRRQSRRRFVQGVGAVGLALAAGCGRWPGQASQPRRVYRFGRLIEGRLVVGSAIWEELTQGLHELGYVEGESFVWEIDFAEGQYERLPDLAASLIHRPVDLIVALGPYAISAARDATSTIPIVMPISGDPVALGHVASLARPGGNVTGLSSLSPQMSAKRLQLLGEALPGTRRVAVL